MSDALAHTPLALALRAAVPLHMLQLQAQGGPARRARSRAKEVAALLGAKGDVLLYGGGHPSEVAALFNRLAHALAVLACQPGGVRRCFGQSWEATCPGMP